MQWRSVEISAIDRRSIYVPAGCANAWITTSVETTLHYYMSEMFAPTSASGIRYDDPAFNVRWPMVPKVISDRDRAFPDFDLTLIE